MAGKNIKQLTNVVAPALTDILYEVQSDTDYNITLQQIKTLFGVGDVEQWQTESIANGTTKYINIASGTTYGAVEIHYLVKRSGRGYRTGVIALLVDDSHTNGVSASDNYLGRYDDDDLGLNLDDGKLSSGTIQLKAVADASDANPCVFNYQIVSKRPITVT
jgi:hypothetical protein